MDQITRIIEEEEWKRERLQDCGLSLLEADDAMLHGVDYHELARFQAKHPDCEPTLACRILATK